MLVSGTKCSTLHVLLDQKQLCNCTATINFQHGAQHITTVFVQTVSKPFGGCESVASTTHLQYIRSAPVTSHIAGAFRSEILQGLPCDRRSFVADFVTFKHLPLQRRSGLSVFQASVRSPKLMLH